MAALVALALGGESNMWSWLNRVPSRWALSCIVAEVRWAFGPTLFPPLASFPTEEPLDLLLQLPPSCLPSVVIPTRIQSRQISQYTTFTGNVTVGRTITAHVRLVPITANLISPLHR
ncbi:hypothetical protein M747DRAFT_319367 [Aspergillus niger ATCC 13496]|uniref:Uncharacterized protein n=3 Tax=Aspergillus niger TaxID=5061 RepID=A2QZU2_ASPNC|nr:hypothetical protein An12g06170 [Aspergillus niger]RDH14588.1 hypothetical protein M747DRAFT_319367 [Aspergillus niger ATCC 13496]CAK41154.1 hypothetical protein An12g06170 [Aspergillus niger]